MLLNVHRGEMPIRDGSVTLIYLYWLAGHKAPSYLEGLGGMGGRVGGGQGMVAVCVKKT